MNNYIYNNEQSNYENNKKFIMFLLYEKFVQLSQCKFFLIFAIEIVF